MTKDQALTTGEDEGSAQSQPGCDDSSLRSDASASAEPSVQWFDPAKTLPEDGQECLLMPLDRGGLVTVAVYGPISYDAKFGAWCDLFRSSEAGEIVSPKDVGLWTAWAPIAPPDAPQPPPTSPSDSAEGE